jgi:hypothetical protein
MPNGTPEKGQTPAEAGAMICGIGLIGGFVVFAINYIGVLFRDGFRGWPNLFDGLLIMCGPWIVGLAISIYFGRRETGKSKG